MNLTDQLAKSCATMPDGPRDLLGVRVTRLGSIYTVEGQHVSSPEQAAALVTECLARRLRQWEESEDALAERQATLNYVRDEVQKYRYHSGKQRRAADELSGAIADAQANALEKISREIRGRWHLKGKER